jgi:hypothetical protein
MISTWRILLVAFWAATGMLWAGPAPSTAEASKLIASAVSIRNFAGAPVESVLLTDPEKKGGAYQYRGEFNVARTGKKISCEDWIFALEFRHGSWSVGEIVRGRCND